MDSSLSQRNEGIFINLKTSHFISYGGHYPFACRPSGSAIANSSKRTARDDSLQKLPGK